MKVHSAAIKLAKFEPAEIIAKSRLAVSRQINRLLLGPVTGGAPQTVITSLDEVSYQSAVRNHILERLRIYDPEIASYPFPAHYPLQFRREKAFQCRVMFLLKNVIVSPSSGMVWLPEGFMLEESVGSLTRIMGWGGNLVEPLLPQRTLRSDTPLVACPPTGYFHWLLEVMPALLHALSLVPQARILIPRNGPAYLYQALEILLGEAYEERVVRSRFPLYVSQLLMPQFEPYSGFVRAGEVATLRKAFAPQCQAGSALYVSRTKTPKRRLSGEQVLEAELARMGFNIVYAEELSFAEQIQTFSQAKLIVAPHGAGLANVVWATPGCQLLEVFPSKYFNDCYARLSIMIGCRYDYLVSATDGRSDHIRVDEVMAKVSSL